jgi:hypothetical protein
MCQGEGSGSRRALNITEITRNACETGEKEDIKMKRRNEELLTQVNGGGAAGVAAGNGVAGVAGGNSVAFGGGVAFGGMFFGREHGKFVPSDARPFRVRKS